jgi:DNA-binding MarR family transcriptional regulator
VNDHSDKSVDSYRSFLLLSEIAGEEPLSQRELSRRAGIAVGLVNSYLKNLVAKGYVRVKNFPRNRYAYLLTPTGIAEKSRLAYQHLSYFTNLYTVARQDYLALFQSLKAEGVTQVVFCGVDEVAEIAYLSMQEAGLELAAVLDDVVPGEKFFGVPIMDIAHDVVSDTDIIVITSLKRTEDLLDKLLDLRGDRNRIYSPGGINAPRSGGCRC